MKIKQELSLLIITHTQFWGEILIFDMIYQWVSIIYSELFKLKIYIFKDLTVAFDITKKEERGKILDREHFFIKQCYFNNLKLVRMSLKDTHNLSISKSAVSIQKTGKNVQVHGF